MQSWPPNKADRSNPFAPSPLRDFLTTAGWSALVPRIGTLILVGPPLGFLPYHRDDRFPRSPKKPGSESRHLYTGGRLGSQQVSPKIILDPILKSSFDLVSIFSMPHQWFTCVRLSETHLPQSFAVTFPKRSPRWLLTNAAFGGLKPAPASRLRGAHPHLLCSFVAHKIDTM